MPGASLVLKSKNKKLGDMAATYASIEGTCPKSCKLRNNGCYAGLGNVGFQVRRLDREAALHKKSSLDLAREEAGLIHAAIRNGHNAGRALRLHVSGDVRSKRGAVALAKACAAWQDQGGGKTFGYTHSWRKIPRNLFGRISILASVEKPSEAIEAIRANYAPSLIVSGFPNGDKAFTVGGIKFIPCVNQTKGITCDNCRLCMDDKMLLSQNAGIAFAVHGVQNKRALEVING